MSSTLIYALREALLMVEEEGLAARQARHERNHRALAAGIDAMGLSLLPPESERLWTLNAVRDAGRSRRGRGAPHPADELQHRGWCRSRAAGGQDLARRLDGRQLDAADACSSSSRRAKARWRRTGTACPKARASRLRQRRCARPSSPRKIRRELSLPACCGAYVDGSGAALCDPAGRSRPSSVRCAAGSRREKVR